MAATKPDSKASAGKSPTTRKPRAARAKSADAKPAARKPRSSRPAAAALNRMSAEERYRMVEVAAYFLAERNHFAGNPVEYWSQAEAQISSMLGE